MYVFQTEDIESLVLSLNTGKGYLELQSCKVLAKPNKLMLDTDDGNGYVAMVDTEGI